MSSKRILVVDDSSTLTFVMADFCREAGYPDVVTAADGCEALEFLNQDPPIGVIFADWNMPKMNGIELLKEVRRNEKTKAIPFILMTAQDKGDILEALKLGANDYVAKPVSFEAFKKKLEHYLNR